MEDKLMAKVYGIDLGTTYSAIATLDNNGLPVIIDNDVDGTPFIASAVYFPENGEPVIGEEAKKQAEVEPGRVVQFVKREIGKADAQTWEFNGIKYDPITISALILKRIKKYVEQQNNTTVSDVVITCPAYFGIKERNETREAGKIAGLNVLDIINEPTAAALNYCLREFKENRKIMVYDLGGGTFDITLFDYSVDDENKATIDILATGGNDRLGGVDWDNLICEHITEWYCEDNRIDERSELDSDVRQQIQTQAENIKIGLTKMPSKKAYINSDRGRASLVVNKDKFNEIASGKVDETMAYVRNLLDKVNVSANDIDTVLLVGGSTRMTMIEEAVKAMFPGKVKYEDPDKAVAKGAALAAAIKFNEILDKRVHISKDGEIEPRKEHTGEKGEDNEDEKITREQADNLKIRLGPDEITEITYIDKLPRSFGPGVMNDNDEYVIDNLLFIGDPSPAEIEKTYETTKDNMPRIVVRIFENWGEDRENTYVIPCIDRDGQPQYTDPDLKVEFIGQLELTLPLNTPQKSPIDVTFSFSSAGLDVTARNPNTNERISAELASYNTKNREEMEETVKVVKDSNPRGQINS